MPFNDFAYILPFSHKKDVNLRYFVNNLTSRSLLRKAVTVCTHSNWWIKALVVNWKIICSLKRNTNVVLKTEKMTVICVIAVFQSFLQQNKPSKPWTLLWNHKFETSLWACRLLMFWVSLEMFRGTYISLFAIVFNL